MREFATLLHFDIFGKSVAMNVAGQTTYNTICGLLFTICIIVLVLVYGVVKAEMMWNYDATSFMSKEVNNSIDMDKIYT